MPSRAGLPLNRTSPTFSMMGSSTPIASAQRGAGPGGVGAFGDSCGAAARYSSSVWPCASAMPSARFRLRSGSGQNRSPMPARPAKVSGLAPRATPSRVISASPRVISAARGLCPSPETLQDSGRDRNDVFQCSRQLHPDDIVMGVHPKCAEWRRCVGLPAPWPPCGRRQRPGWAAPDKPRSQSWVRTARQTATSGRHS